MIEGTGVGRADPHQHPTDEARTGTWWICLVAAGWIGWNVHDAADRMARTATAGRTCGDSSEFNTQNEGYDATEMPDSFVMSPGH